MFKMRIQTGGAVPTRQPIYCGSKETVPRGKVRGRPNQCFMAGRKAGFYAGVLKGQSQVAVQPDLRKTEAQWRALTQRQMQVQAREWGMRNTGRSKTNLLNDFLDEARRRNLIR